MAGRRLLHTRLFFSCLSEIGSKRKMSFGRQLLSNSLCVSVTQCPKFKATVSISVAINPLGDRDRNNLKTAVWQILLNPCTVVYLVLCTSPDLQLSILIIPPSPLAQKAVTTKKKIMNSVDVVTKVALLPKGEFHNLKISQKQDKREQ